MSQDVLKNDDRQWKDANDIAIFEFEKNWLELDIPNCCERDINESYKHAGEYDISAENEHSASESADDVTRTVKEAARGSVHDTEHGSVMVRPDTSVESIFAYGPLTSGFGITLGNSLRRVLLSLIRGTAIVGIRIPGVEHEFSVIPGMIENVVNLILNLRQIKFKLNGRNKIKVVLPIRGKQSAGNNIVIRAKDILIPKNTMGDVGVASIKTDIHGNASGINGVGSVSATLDSISNASINEYQVDILNPEQYICTVNSSVDLDIEIIMAIGRGYVTSIENKETYGADYGVLYIDSVFTPVTRVSYDVTNMRTPNGVADLLTVQVQTDGVISPKEAIGAAARIITEQCKNLIYFDENEIVDLQESVQHSLSSSVGTASSTASNIAEADAEINDFLLMRIEEMEFSQRASNCLKSENIIYVHQLVTRSEQSLLRVPNLGRKSLDEINAVLLANGLRVGMNISKPTIKQIVAMIAKKEEQSNSRSGLQSDIWG